MQILATITQVLLSLGLIVLVLVHSGKGGGLSDMFGGGMGSNLGASGVAEKNLNRITVTLAVIWLLAIVSMGIITRIQTVVVS